MNSPVCFEIEELSEEELQKRQRKSKQARKTETPTVRPSAAASAPPLAELDSIDPLPSVCSPTLSHVAWPGHVLDVDSSTLPSAVHPALCEGHLMMELVHRLLFMWGLTPSYLPQWKQELQAQVSMHTYLHPTSDEEYDSPAQESGLQDHADEGGEADMDISPAHSEDENDLGPVTVPAQYVPTDPSFPVIEEYPIDQDKNHRHLPHKRAEQEQDDEDEVEAISRSSLSALQRSLRSIAQLDSALENLQRLIIEDYTGYLTSNESRVYLSHIFVLLGPSISFPRRGCCLVRRQTEITPAPNSNTTLLLPTGPIPPKTREEDGWIKSIMRRLLQHKTFDQSSSAPMSRSQSKLHFVVSYSSSSHSSDQMSATTGDTVSLTHARLPSSLFTKWRPARPIYSIRLGHSAATNDTLDDETMSYSGTVTSPIVLS